MTKFRKRNIELDYRNLRSKLEILLGSHHKTNTPISENAFLEIIKVCHSLAGRYIPYDKLPNFIKLVGIKNFCKELVINSKGKIEGSYSFSYHDLEDRFYKSKVAWGDHKSVHTKFPTGNNLSRSFCIHNHTDDVLSKNMTSLFSSKDFSSFMFDPNMQFMVMTTKGRIFLVLKTTKTAEAFLYEDLNKIIKEEEIRFRKREKQLKNRKKVPKLNITDFVHLQLNFNAAVCRRLRLGFYASDTIPNEFRDNKFVDIKLYKPNN